MRYSGGLLDPNAFGQSALVSLFLGIAALSGATRPYRARLLGGGVIFVAGLALMRSS